MRRILFCAIAVTLFQACSGSKTNENITSATTDNENVSDADNATVRELPLPHVPTTLRDPQSRGAYIVNHFWDAMDFSDRSVSLDTAFMEQSFANFASLFEVVGSDAVGEGMKQLVARATVDSEASAFLAHVAEKYLYDPNSPMLDEGSYILFAEAFSENDSIQPDLKVRPRWLLEAACKNRPGNTAADFSFTDRDGNRNTMRKWVAGAASQVLMLFYDPDCESCKNILNELTASQRLAEMIAEGQMRVLAVYIGNDSELWHNTCATLPQEWTVAIDGSNIEDNELYVFPAMPVMYLLDNNATVIVKDFKHHVLTDPSPAN